jgi:hypothetical protein
LNISTSSHLFFFYLEGDPPRRSIQKTNAIVLRQCTDNERRSQGFRWSSCRFKCNQPRASLTFVTKPAKCDIYHIAMQNLVKDLPLHGHNDQTRHGGVNIMSYAQEGRYHEPPKKEHAGVVHLVHCWPMQGQKQKVSKKIINLYLLIYTPPENRVSTSLGTSQTSQRVLLKPVHIIILRRTLRQPSVSCLKPPSPIYTKNIRRHLKLAYGFKRTQVPLSAGPLYTSFKASSTRTRTM